MEVHASVLHPAVFSQPEKDIYIGVQVDECLFMGRWSRWSEGWYRR